MPRLAPVVGMAPLDDTVDDTVDVSIGQISLTGVNMSGGMAEAASLNADLISLAAELACSSTDLIKLWTSKGIEGF
jgi:hypothetical protein